MEGGWDSAVFLCVCIKEVKTSPEVPAVQWYMRNLSPDKILVKTGCTGPMG